jgi:uncharacterized protein YecT (DUF1311 family)
MLKSLAILTLTCISLLTPHHSSANSDLSKKYQDVLATIQNNESTCIDKAEGATSGILECLGKYNKEFDALLNASYRSLRNAVKENTAYYDALKIEQLAWIKLNKAILDNVSMTGGGGSLDNLKSGSISNQLLINRIELFIYLLHILE